MPLCARLCACASDAASSIYPEIAWLAACPVTAVDASVVAAEEAWGGGCNDGGWIDVRCLLLLLLLMLCHRRLPLRLRLRLRLRL